MSGILDGKTRVMDTIITREGRRQMVSGNLRIRFVSFTDADTFYQADVASGSSDPSDRVFLEACHLPQDQITFEADDSGRLMPYRGSNLGVIDGKVLSGSSDAFLEVITGSLFASTSETLLGSSIDNFNKLQMVRTENTLFDLDKEFIVSTNDASFFITDARPFGKTEVKQASIDKVENLFQDKRLSRMPNFRHLPPVNKPKLGSSTSTPLGDYPLLGQRATPMSYDEVKVSLANKDFVSIDFHETTLLSNVIGQFFEIRQDQLLKLDVIDFGEFRTSDPDAPDKHVFFVGKLFIDGFNAHTFVSIFTLVFEA